jgi:predicted transposase YdaD
VVEALDWSTLKREPGTFVDESGESRTDLLFSARVRDHEQRLFVYLLFEHQSRPDPGMPFRMLTY